MVYISCGCAKMIDDLMLFKSRWTRVITGPPTHNVGGQISNGRRRLLSVVVCRGL